MKPKLRVQQIIAVLAVGILISTQGAGTVFAGEEDIVSEEISVGTNDDSSGYDESADYVSEHDAACDIGLTDAEDVQFGDESAQIKEPAEPDSQPADINAPMTPSNDSDLFAITVDSGDCGASGNNVTWIFDNEGVLSLSGNGSMASWLTGEATPWSQYRDHIGTVIIGSDIINIGDFAFSGSTSLNTVEIPNSVTNIGDYAFSGSTNLNVVEIPNSVISIGDSVFEGCTSLLSTEMPDSITSMGKSVFQDCTNLTDVRLPGGVTSIGTLFFSNCTSLINVEISNSVTSIDDYAFNGCVGLSNMNLPSSVTRIGESAFYNCTGLSSVNIPNSVTSIGHSAFAYCTSLASINIPNSVTSIGDYAFMLCESLISVDIPTSITSIGEGVFGYCKSLSRVKISNNVTDIEKYAFYSCSSLTEINFPTRVTSIGESAFVDCTKLGRIVFAGNTSPSIVSTAFSGVFDTGIVLFPESATGFDDEWKKTLAGLTNWSLESYISSSPTLIVSSVSRHSDTEGTVVFRSDETGEYYFAVVEGGGSKPTIDINGPGKPINANTDTNINLSNLTAGEKDIYIVAKDEAGNVSPDTFYVTIPAPTYAIAYNANGGTGSHIDTNLAVDSRYTVLNANEAGISRPGYTFTGWNTKPDGSGTSYTAGDTITITTDMAFYAQWSVYAINSVSVSPKEISVYRGGTQQFTAVVDVTGDAAQTVTWSVGSTMSVIDSNGMLYVGENETAETLTITVTSTVDPGKKDTATVTLMQYGTQYLVRVGFSVFTGSGARSAIIDAPYSKFSQLLVDGVVLDASHYSAAEGSTIITLKESYLKTLANGEYLVMVMFTDGQAETPLVVDVRDDNVKVTGVTLNKKSASIVVGNTLQLTATVSPDNATDKTLTWTSSDTSIVTVDENGLVRGVKAGKATITATTGNGGHTAACEVTVTGVSGTTDASSAPQTGDSNSIWLWTWLGILILSLSIGLMVWRKKQKSNRL